MVFSSSVFLFIFLPVLLLLYFIAGKKAKNIVLLFASLFFYAWGEPRNIIVMLLSIAINYFLAIGMEKSMGRRKLYFLLAVFYNIGILFIFKYLNFTVDTVNRLLEHPIALRRVALPIGISFYTFQMMSYIMDVYRENVKAQKNILSLGLYISLFPQLIAGPIVRYIDIEGQLACRTSSWENMHDGICRFAIGFSKKILLADQLSVFVDLAFAGQYPSIITNWAGIVGYTLQIYFDFNGYSDMAIGLGKMFGFSFPENFNYPYISKSIQEFWRRWHITLGSWFRDYLYIPLGGSRQGKLKTYINISIVFLLTGLWHGASFNFILWGGYYALFLIAERMGLRKVLEKLPAFARHIYAILAIMFGWVFFRSSTWTEAIRYLHGMFSLSGNDVAHFNYIMNGKYWFCMAAGIFLSLPHKNITTLIQKSSAGRALADISILAVFYIAICYMIGSGYSPFLYFRF